MEKWNAQGYQKIQRAYQFQYGMALIERLKPYCSLSGKRVWDLGCGEGSLTAVLQELSGPGGQVTGVDLDGNMLKKARLGHPEIRFIQADLLDFLRAKEECCGLLFSNAALHWLADPAAMAAFFTHAQNVLQPGGVGAVHFSLAGNAQEARLFLERQLRRYLGDPGLVLFRPFLRFAQCKAEISARFSLLSAEELLFHPFSGRPMFSFLWMLHSQPLLQYLTEQQLQEFSRLLYQAWQAEPVEVVSRQCAFVFQRRD